MNSTLERPAANPESDHWPELLERGIRGLLSDLGRLVRQAIESAAEELLRQREGSKPQAIEPEPPVKPAPIAISKSEEKRLSVQRTGLLPGEDDRPRGPLAELANKLGERPVSDRLYFWRKPRGLTMTEGAVVEMLDRFDRPMLRSEILAAVGGAFPTVSSAAFSLCRRGIAEHDNGAHPRFRLVRPAPAGLDCTPDD